MQLKADHLACHRGTRLLLDDFSLEVRTGKAVWLTGPNGAGKSTLLRVLAGVQRPLRGRVERLTASLYLPSAPGFDEGLSLLQNFDWWCAVEAGQRDRIAQALDHWQLGAFANQRFAALSQGQRQRASLARLMLSPARLWLLDEPLTHLDRAGQALWQQCATAHLERGGAIVAATHATELLPQAQIVKLGDAT